MKPNSRRLFVRIIFDILSILAVIFIFSNSMRDGTTSTNDSSRVVELLKRILSFLGIDGEVSHSFVRTLGHFSEFLILGTILSITFNLNNVKFMIFPFIALSTSMLTAITDECIQLFVPGRAFEISDMLVDTLGAAFGIAIVTIVVAIRKAAKRKKILA